MNMDSVSQSEKICEGQALNRAGGFVFEVDDFTRLRRFLILGAEGNQYVTSPQLKYENAQAIVRLLAEGHGPKVVDEISGVSQEGRAPKQSPGIFALALCVRLGDKSTKTAAFAALRLVCRTASTLFEFVEYCQSLGKVAGAMQGRENPKQRASWGRAMRNGVARWYLEKEPMQLAYQVTKYSQRNGWSHQDLLRLAHPKAQEFLAKKQRRQQEAGPSVLPPADKELDTNPAGNQEAVDDHATEESSVHKHTGVQAVTSGVACMNVDKPSEPMQLTPEYQQKLADYQALFSYMAKAKLPVLAEDQDKDLDVLHCSSQLAEYLVDAHKLRKNVRVPSKTTGSKRKHEVDDEADVEPANAKEADEQSQEAIRAALQVACDLVRKHKFGHEHIGDNALMGFPELWTSFLEAGMPMTALIRNLGRMTSLGVFDQLDNLKTAIEKITDEKAIHGARIHPITVLGAMKTYQQGRGEKGKLHWQPVPAIEAALETAFHKAFKNVAPTGKRYLLGLDVSGSMQCANVVGMPHLNCAEATGAMAMVTVRTEQNVQVMAFSGRFTKLDITKKDSLQDVLSKTDCLPFDGTDCSLPMLYALEKNIPVDVFIVYTDNETYHGSMHPCEALKKYRKATGIPAKLIVMAFSASSFTIADPSDAGMLDVAGLDSGAPQIIQAFVEGSL